MIRRIVSMTSGDWNVIELHTGKHYRLSGKEKAAHRGLVTEALADASAQDQIVDRRSSLVETDTPFIREFLPNDDNETFRVRADDGDEFTVTADELKTMLTA